MRKVIIQYRNTQYTSRHEQVIDDAVKVEPVGSFIAILRESSFPYGSDKGKITYVPADLIEFVRDEFDFTED